MKRVVFLIVGLVIAALVLPPLYYMVVPAETVQLPAPGRRIDVGGGVFVNATDEGSGRPIVLVHGLPGSAYDWAPLSQALAAHGHRVIAYDRVGYGHSDGRRNDAFTPDGNADDLLGLLETEDLRDVTVVGWSYGGPVAIIAGRKDPSRIERLVLIGSGGPSDDPQEPPLHVDQPAVEGHQHVGDARHVVLREHRRVVPMGIPVPQRVPFGDRFAPVEHLLPVGHVGGGGGLDQQPGVAGLAV